MRPFGGRGANGRVQLATLVTRQAIGRQSDLTANLSGGDGNDRL